MQILSQNPHHLFSSEDSKKIADEPRFIEFISHYNRYVAITPAGEKLRHKKDVASTEMCNAFFRWAALGGCTVDLRVVPFASLEKMIIHTNYLLHSFYPQALEAGLLGATNSYQKMTQLKEMQHDLQQELFSRQSMVNRSTLTHNQKSYLWVLGGAYDNVSLVSWDPSENYLLACGTKGNKKYILIYGYDAMHRDLSLRVEAPISLDENFLFEPGALIWGQDARTFILSGHVTTHAKDISVLYTFNSAKDTIKIVQKIAEKPAAKASQNSIFWIPADNKLFTLLGGIGMLFEWDASQFLFTQAGELFPGFQHAQMASCSADGKCFLTSHQDFPYVRLSRLEDRLGASSVLTFDDKLTDVQWHPQLLFFIARSVIEKDLVVLYRYDADKKMVTMQQRLHIGGDISRMQWSCDGSYLFVHGEGSLMYGAGARIFSLIDDQLSAVEVLTASLPDLQTVDSLVYSSKKNLLLALGRCEHYASGRMFFSFAQKPETKEDLATRGKPPILKSPWKIVDNLFNTVTVYDYLNDIPNQKKVGFGSLVMLVSASNPSVALAVCDLPEVVSANDGKRFACGKKLTQSDLSAESMSCWWLVEGESWLSRVDNPVRPFANISLKNMATGEKLCITRDRSPMHGICPERNLVGLSSQTGFLSIDRDSKDCFDWEIGESVSLVARGDVVGLSPEPASHPILQKVGIARLSTKPQGVKTVHDDNSFNWIVYRNISVTTIFDQARQGSECAEYMCKKIDTISGRNAEQVRDVVYSHVIEKSLLF
jgi:hypothetical protein